MYSVFQDKNKRTVILVGRVGGLDVGRALLAMESRERRQRNKSDRKRNRKDRWR